MKIYHKSYSGEFNGARLCYTKLDDKGNVILRLHPDLIQDLRESNLVDGMYTGLQAAIESAGQSFMERQIESLRDVETGILQDIMDRIPPERAQEVLSQPDYQARLQKAKELAGMS